MFAQHRCGTLKQEVLQRNENFLQGVRTFQSSGILGINLMERVSANWSRSASLRGRYGVSGEQLLALQTTRYSSRR